MSPPLTWRQKHSETSYSLEYQTLDKVEKPNNPGRCAPSSESFSNYYLRVRYGDFSSSSNVLMMALTCDTFVVMIDSQKYQENIADIVR
jgi:hypothetical protein